MAEQNAPVRTETGEQARPVELPSPRMQQMHDIGAVVALAFHHIGLRPDNFFRRTNPGRYAQHLGSGCMLEPKVVHDGTAIAGTEDQVDVSILEMNFTPPVRMSQLGFVAEVQKRFADAFEIGAADKKIM